MTAPYPDAIEASTSAFIIVDAQNDFCEGGSLAVPHGADILPLVNKLKRDINWKLVVYTQDWHPKNHVSFASNNNSAPFVVKDIPGVGPQMMWPDHCVQGSKGAEFHPSLDVSVATTGGADAAAVVDAPAGTRDGDRMLVVQKGTNAKVDSYSGFGDQTQDKSIVNKTCLEEALRANGIKTVYVCGLALDYCVSATCKDAAKLGFTTFCVLDATRGIAPDSIAAEMAAMKAAGVHVVATADAVITAFKAHTPDVIQAWRALTAGVDGAADATDSKTSASQVGDADAVSKRTKAQQA